jgi:hypothetical protein
VRERQTQTKHQSVYAGSRLKPAMRGKVLSYMPAFQPYRGKPAVRNDREGRGNIGIIRSPICASTLPDCGGREVTRVPTAKAATLLRLLTAAFGPGCVKKASYRHRAWTNRRPIATMWRLCSDSLVTASQMDGVFGTDNRDMEGCLGTTIRRHRALAFVEL